MDVYLSTRRSPLLFFILAFAATWSCWIPWSIWISSGPAAPASSPMMLLNLLGTFGPAAAALLLTAVLAGRRAVAALLGRLREWRVGATWYALSVLLWPLMVAAALVVERALGGGTQIAWNGLLPQVVVALIVGLGEEIGWRGYALPALLGRHGALAASILLGAVWTAWHLPAYLVAVDLTNPLLALDFGAYALTLIAAAILFTWLWLHTRASLLMAVLFHAAFNALTTTVLLGDPNGLLGRLLSLVTCAVALAVVAVDRRQFFAPRQRLALE